MRVVSEFVKSALPDGLRIQKIDGRIMFQPITDGGIASWECMILRCNSVPDEELTDSDVFDSETVKFGFLECGTSTQSIMNLFRTKLMAGIKRIRNRAVRPMLWRRAGGSFWEGPKKLDMDLVHLYLKRGYDVRIGDSA
jgi:hypothetical protein